MTPPPLSASLYSRFASFASPFVDYPTHCPSFRYGALFSRVSPLPGLSVICIFPKTDFLFLPHPCLFRVSPPSLTPTHQQRSNPRPPRPLADHYGSAEPLFVSPAFYTPPTRAPALTTTHIAGSLSIITPHPRRQTGPRCYKMVYIPPPPTRRAHPRIRRRCRPGTHQENEEHQRTRRSRPCRSPPGPCAPADPNTRDRVLSSDLLCRSRFRSIGTTILTSVISTPFASFPPFVTAQMPR